MKATATVSKRVPRRREVSEGMLKYLGRSAVMRLERAFSKESADPIVNNMANMSTPTSMGSGETVWNNRKKAELALYPGSVGSVIRLTCPRAMTPNNPASMTMNILIIAANMKEV